MLTYAKFGYLCQQHTDFHANFDYIICDELHSLFHFQDYSAKPNLHSIAVMGIKSAINNSKTTVIALTATPSIVKAKLNSPYFELPIDQDTLIHYDQEQIIEAKMRHTHAIHRQSCTTVEQELLESC